MENNENLKNEKTEKKAEPEKGAKAEKPEAKPKKKKKSPVVVPTERYMVTSSPHLHSKHSVSKIMWTVNACLAPAAIAGIYIFGIKAFFIIFFSLLGAVGAEFAWQKLTKKKVTISDGSAFLTGLLLAFNLPPTSQWWMPLVGGVFAIIIVKQLFGGLGMNIFNPALAARGFLLASWPQEMTNWAKPVNSFFGKIDGGTYATPLSLVKLGKIEQFNQRFPDMGAMLKNFLLGTRGGCIGETCAALLILGGIVLIAMKYIDWQIPAVYIGTVAVVMFLAKSLGWVQGLETPMDTMLFHMFAGGLILGAFYMATDYVTCPATVKGRIIFAAGCGVITCVIRMWGGLPEGVCYSILIMNCFTPLIDDKVKPVVYGTKKEKQPA